MLNKKQISEIREHLEKAQNPVFFFDNDVDGLCSFLLLRKLIGRGKGFPIRSFPSMTKSYFRKVAEFNSDYIFILDKPLVSRDFFEEVEKTNIPVVWIDHHIIDENEVPENVFYYNPLKQEIPTTFLCWQVSQKNSDLWLALCGCIADHYLPDFYEDFKKEFPELSNNSNDAFGVLYHSEIGKVARIMNCGLKDKTTNVIFMIKILMSSTSPYNVLEEGNKTNAMHKRFDFIEGKHRKFIEKAKQLAGNSKLLFFQYSGDMSISSDLANELFYLFPKKIILVVYVSGAKANISGRGKNVKKIVLNAIDGFENATGGGHDDAVGAMIATDDLEVFRKRVEDSIQTENI